jgi:hypothetical protein
MLNATYGLPAMLPFAALWVAGQVMTAGRPSPIGESTSSTTDPDAQVRRVANGGLAAVIKRLRARREQRLTEQREFKAWLQITAEPLW